MSYESETKDQGPSSMMSTPIRTGENASLCSKTTWLWNWHRAQQGPQQGATAMLHFALVHRLPRWFYSRVCKSWQSSCVSNLWHRDRVNHAIKVFFVGGAHEGKRSHLHLLKRKCVVRACVRVCVRLVVFTGTNICYVCCIGRIVTCDGGNVVSLQRRTFLLIWTKIVSGTLLPCQQRSPLLRAWNDVLVADPTLLCVPICVGRKRTPKSTMVFHVPRVQIFVISARSVVANRRGHARVLACDLPPKRRTPVRPPTKKQCSRQHVVVSCLVFGLQNPTFQARSGRRVALVVGVLAAATGEETKAQESGRPPTIARCDVLVVDIWTIFLRCFAKCGELRSASVNAIEFFQEKHFHMILSPFDGVDSGQSDRLSDVREQTRCWVHYPPFSVDKPTATCTPRWMLVLRARRYAQTWTWWSDSRYWPRWEIVLRVCLLHGQAEGGKDTTRDHRSPGWYSWARA